MTTATSNTPKQARGHDDDRPGIWVGYGKLVRLFRDNAGLTQDELAERIGYSGEQVSSVEQGRRPAKTPFTQAAEQVLNAGGALQALQDDVDLAKLPAFFRDFAILELDALSRYSYDPLLIPGLLQTEDYARALFQGHCPPMNTETIEQNTEARLSRQKLLGKTPLVAFSFIIEEASLRNPLGNSALMREQLLHLRAVADQGNIDIQVMRRSTGYHPGLSGPFVLVETTDHQHFGYIESQEVGVLVNDAARISTLGSRYGRLRSQALNTEESAAYIEQLAEEP